MTHLAEAGKGKVKLDSHDQEQHPRTEAFSSGAVGARIIPGSEAYRDAVKALIIGRMSYDEFISLVGAQEPDEP
jgi:hypothetical protein